MKILKNTTASPVFVIDTGINIAASTNYTIPPQEFGIWASSVNVDTYIDNGTFVVNDGYDDLKADLGKKHIHEESVTRDAAFIATASVLVTSASILTLTASSRLVYVFNGTTAGQIVKLPSATTLNIGYRYEFWNTSTQSIEIRDGNNSSIFIIAAYQKTWTTLQDNSTVAGTWLIEANFMGGSGGGNGTLCMGFDGTASTGRWLEGLTNIASNLTPYVIAGVKAIRALSLATYGNSTITVTILKNGVALDTISLSTASKITKLNLNHILANNDGLSAQVTSGSGARPVLILWL